MSDELRERQRYKHCHTFAMGQHRATLRYRRSRWHKLDFDCDDIKQRRLFGWIEIENERVGALELYENRAEDYLDNSSFFEIMDASSQIESDLAAQLMTHWSHVGSDIFGSGTLLEFRAAWTKPQRCPQALWASAANAIISRECPTYGLLMLKAFPLEYEGNENGNARLTDGRARRQRAMRRHYARLLGVRSFPDDNEWMYKINPAFSGVIEPPSSP